MRSSQYSSGFLVLHKALASSAYACSCNTVLGDDAFAIPSADEDIEGQQLNNKESSAASLDAGLETVLRRANVLFGADSEVTKACQFETTD